MRSHLIPWLLMAASASAPVAADTIRLRNGTEYEGVVLREDGDAYVLAIQVTKSIRDERRIAKNEVLEIVREKKDDLAFEQIKDFVPTPDLLGVDDYNQRIRAVENFMEKFNASRHLKAADKMLKVLDEERKLVDAGALKFEGRMIEGPERAARAYPLDARIAATRIRELGEDGDLLLALRAWDTLERDYVGSHAYREAIPFAVRLMRTQLVNVSQMLDTYDDRLRERQAGLARMPEKDRARSEEQIALEAAAHARRVENERKEGIRWTSLSPWDKESLQAAKSRLEQEIKRLQQLDPSSLQDAEAAWNSAWEILSSGPGTSDASAAISAARAAQLPAKYLGMLEQKAPSR